MKIDHIVLWSDHPSRALEFYVDVVGLEPVRREAFEAGRVGFPSVRVNESTLFDLMARDAVERVRRFTGGGANAGGAPVNHVCLSMSAEELGALERRLEERGIELRSGGERAFGARGEAVRSVYFTDPDGNVLEIRHYDEGARGG